MKLGLEPLILTTSIAYSCTLFSPANCRGYCYMIMSVRLQTSSMESLSTSSVCLATTLTVKSEL